MLLYRRIVGTWHSCIVAQHVLSRWSIIVTRRRRLLVHKGQSPRSLRLCWTTRLQLVTLVFPSTSSPFSSQAATLAWAFGRYASLSQARTSILSSHCFSILLNSAWCSSNLWFNNGTVFFSPNRKRSENLLDTFLESRVEDLLALDGEHALGERGCFPLDSDWVHEGIVQSGLLFRVRDQRAF